MQIDNGTHLIEISGELCCTGVVCVRTRQYVHVIIRVRDKNKRTAICGGLFVCFKKLNLMGFSIRHDKIKS
jgi:hypothetical protein